MKKYKIKNNCIYKKNGSKPIQQTNFNATITYEIQLTIKGSTQIKYIIEGMSGGDKLLIVNIESNKFNSMDWAEQNWGTRGRLLEGARPFSIANFIQEQSKPEKIITYDSVGYKDTNNGMIFAFSEGIVTHDGLSKYPYLKKI